MDNFKIILKKALKSLIKMKVVKIVLVLILILAVLLPAFVYYITIDDGTYKEGDWSNTPYVASTYTSNVEIGEDGITSETTAQDLWDELIKNGSNVDEYLDSPEELEKLMNAEIITQYPKIGNKDAKLDGIIEFERYKTDGTSSKLKYLDSEEFNKYIEENNTGAMDYFTLDEEGNALIAVTDITTETLTSNDSEMDISEYTDTLNDSNKKSDGEYKRVEINVREKPIYYKNVVSKYTMPFQYLWKLLVISDDKEFVLELADLVEDSEITISIYDNITTTVNTDVYTYSKQTKTDTYVRLTTGAERSWTEEDNTDGIDYEIRHQNKYENNAPIIDLTKANVWIVDYSKKYNYKGKEQTSDSTNSKDLEDTNYEEKVGSPENLTNNPGLVNNSHAQSFLSGHRARAQDVLDAAKEKEGSDEYKYTMEDYEGHTAVESINVSDVQCNYYTHKINRKEKTTEKKYSQEYISGSVINNPKVEKNKGEINFVTILCKASHIEAKKRITSELTSWLIELLETGDTADKVELTKYLINKVLGKEKLDTDFDFSIYEKNDFKNISYGGNYGDWNGTGTQEDFIQAVAPYAVFDMEQHGIYASVTIAQAIIESGWGKDDIAINYKNFFGMKAKGLSNTGNEYWDGTGVALTASEGGTSYFRVYDSLMNSVYDHGRNFHVTATYGQHGVLNCIGQNLGPKEQLKRIAQSGYAVNRDGSIAKPDGIHTYDEYLYEYLIVKYNLEQYDTMTSDDFDTVGGNQEIVEIAKSKLGCPYVFATAGPNTFDCSGFVYWVYSQKGINVPRSTEGYSSYVGTVKEISWDAAQPGDILIIFSYERNKATGHAGIYLGNNEYIHSPQTGDVVKISNGAQSMFKHVFRFDN